MAKNTRTLYWPHDWDFVYQLHYCHIMAQRGWTCPPSGLLPCCTPDPNTWPACLPHMRRGRGCGCWRPHRARCWCVPSARASASRWTGPRSVEAGQSFFREMRQLFILGYWWGFWRSWRHFLFYLFLKCDRMQHVWTCTTYRDKLTLMVLSADPVTNHWLPGSTAMDLTQPRWPLMTCHRKHHTVINRLGKNKSIHNVL